MHMIERLKKAIELNEEADNLAMTCSGLHDARRLDQMVCDADNASRDFVRRHGREVIAEITLLLSTLADVADYDFGYVGGEANTEDQRSLYSRVKRARQGALLEAAAKVMREHARQLRAEGHKDARRVIAAAESLEFAAYGRMTWAQAFDLE